MIKHRAQDKNERGLSVMEKLKLDFYYGREAEQFTFYRLPKALITDACFKGMTNNAKLLYGLMLDRMSLSKKRGWLDEANKVFIKYSLNNIEEDLNVSRKTASSLLKELEEIGLIDMIQQPGVANIIYVKNFVSERDQEVRNQREPESKCKRETGVKSKPVEKVHQCKNSTGEKTTPVEKSNQCSFEPGTSGKITLVPGGKLHPSNIEIDNNINNNNSINQSYQSIDKIDVMDETAASSSAAMIFQIMLHPTVGIVNKLLGLDINWLNDPRTALYCVAILTAWLNSGINFLYFSAGLGNIDETIYERASVDGASGVQQFFHLTLPGLSPIMFYTVVVNIIQAFQSFGQIKILTEGGPNESTNVIVYSIYRDAFFNYRFGSASAQSVILFIIIMLITLVMFRMERKGVNY